MTRWYEQHYTNPYPMLKECEELAELGKVTVSQVKQWFVNVRRRTHNQYRKRRATNDKTIKESFSVSKLNDCSISCTESQTNDSHEYSSYDLVNQDEEKNPLIRYNSNQNFYQQQQQLNNSPSIIGINYFNNSTQSSNYDYQLNYLINQQNFLNSF